MPSYNDILYAIEDGVLTITMNRPEKLNAATTPMTMEMVDAFQQADADDSVRAVILTGAGRGFCAGADVSGGNVFAELGARDPGGLLTLQMFACKKPIIAAINGPAVGMGATMILAADIRVASESARFGYVFARRGIVPESASSWFLPRIVGISKALEWCMSGRVFGVEEAKAAGLVRDVVPGAELLAKAGELAREIAANASAVSVALTRQLLWRMLGADHPMVAHRLESKGVDAMGQTRDADEGVLSFLEKRPAVFTMRPSDEMPAFFPWWEEPAFEG
ncbi:MAG: enoyl-CoA hydratase-related protein [Dehalococcoidia bacterium]